MIEDLTSGQIAYICYKTAFRYSGAPLAILMLMSPTELLQAQNVLHMLQALAPVSFI